MSIAANPRIGGSGLGSSGAYTAQVQAYLNRRETSAPLPRIDVARELRRKLTGIPGLDVFVVNPPTIRIGARQSRSSYQYTLQGLDLTQLRDVSAQLETALKAAPGFVERDQRFRQTRALRWRSLSCATAPPPASRDADPDRERA